MLKAYFECELRGTSERSRADSTKFLTFLENEEGERLEVNSKKDFAEYKRQKGVASLGLWRRDGGGYWITLLEFIPKDIE